MQEKITRSRAPLRISFGGGGTEIDPYRTNYGGEILNTTISLYAYTTIKHSLDKNIVTFIASDLQITETYKVSDIFNNQLLYEKSRLKILIATFYTLLKPISDVERLALEITTFCDAPPGSGLGSSSTLTVSLIKAFNNRFSLGYDKHKIAETAFHIERVILGFKGGQQDQYSAAFGGLNYIKFKKNNSVDVQPIAISKNLLNEFEASLLLAYTGISRDSGNIIEAQIKKDKSGNNSYIEDMNKLKKIARLMKKSLENKDIASFGKLLHESWIIKRTLTKMITNSYIDDIYNLSRSLGAYGGKISGAGGGGFFTIICDPENKGNIYNRLTDLGNKLFTFKFTKNGASSWEV